MTQKDSKELPKCKQVNYRVRTKPCNTESQSPLSTLPCTVAPEKTHHEEGVIAKGLPRTIL